MLNSIIFLSLLVVAPISFAANVDKESAGSVSVKVGGSEENYTGQVDRRIVRSSVGALKKKFMECYKAAGQPTLMGKVVMSFEISSDGRVANYQAKSTTLNDPKVGDCVMAAIANIRFPTLPPNSVARVEFPVGFEAR